MTTITAAYAQKIKHELTNVISSPCGDTLALSFMAKDSSELVSYFSTLPWLQERGGGDMLAKNVISALANNPYNQYQIDFWSGKDIFFVKQGSKIGFYCFVQVKKSTPMKECVFVEYKDGEFNCYSVGTPTPSLTLEQFKELVSSKL